MTIRTQQHAGSEAGTTLLELLVVLAILGLLAAIAAPQMARYLESGQRNAALTQVASLSAKLYLFRADMGRYPSTAEGLVALLTAPPNSQNWNGPYVKNAAELRDPWGHYYLYRSPGTQGDFDLKSLGETNSQSRPALGGKVAP
jgi:general secretion pathway protein G